MHGNARGQTCLTDRRILCGAAARENDALFDVFDRLYIGNVLKLGRSIWNSF